jgi:hypothetical protein
MINIDWVRHAESCSNLEYTDLKEIKHDSGFDEDVLVSHSSSRSASIDSIRSINSDSSTNSVLVDKPSIKDDKPAIKDDKPAIKDDKPAIKDDKPAIKDDKPKIADSYLSYFFNSITPDKIVPVIAKQFNLLHKVSHPPLSYLGIQQSINLSLNLKKNYDYYYCSPSTRTIMTALLSLRTLNYNKILNGEPPIKLKIIPYIIEISNIAGVVNQDYQNQIISKDKLDKIIIYIKKWLSEKYFNNFFDHEFNLILHDLVIYLTSINLFEYFIFIIKYNNKDNYCSNNFTLELLEMLKKYYDMNNSHDKLLIFIKKIEKFTDPRFFQSCDIDTTFDDKLDDNKDFNKFYKLLIHDNISILCFSHGSILKKNFKIDKVYNTQIISHEYNLLTEEISNITYDHGFKDKIIEFNKKYNEKTCKQLCGEPNGTLMFSVINNMIINKSDIPIKDSTDELYKKKYLKYKYKYNYLKNKI